MKCCKLEEKDLFTDKSRDRKIKNCKEKCPNSGMGCTEILSPLNMEDHIQICPHRPRLPLSEHISIDCVFRKVGCTFRAIDSDQMDSHIKHYMDRHIIVSINYS